MNLQGKVIVVTGGASGIGKATVLRLVEEGAHVVIADMQEGPGMALASSVEGPGSAEFVYLDVSDHAAVTNTISNIAMTHGRLDGAFNNAGIEGPTAKITDLDPDEWAQVQSVNLAGVFSCVKAEVAQMANQEGGGSIVNTSSVAGVVGLPGASAYNAAKHGVVGITRTVALEFGRSNVRVNAVCPGFIDTPMLNRVSGASAKMRDWLATSIPMRRVANPTEIADVVVWLLSDRSSYVTGIAIPVDGGWTAQ